MRKFEVTIQISSESWVGVVKMMKWCAEHFVGHIGDETCNARSSARGMSVVVRDGTVKRVSVVKRGERALRELELSAVTKANKRRVGHVRLALQALDDERYRLHCERDEARTAASGYAAAGVEEGLWEAEECEDVNAWGDPT